MGLRSREYREALAAGEVDPPVNEYAVLATLFVEGKLWTVNAERSGHWTSHRRKTAEWREAAAWEGLAAQLPRLSSASFRFIPFQRAGVLADSGAHLPPAKAVIDGLVDAGLLTDDSPEFVPSITLDAPRRDKNEPEGLLVVIAGSRVP